MRVLGIDYGLERTGLAVSDPSGKVVFPLKTLRLADFGTRAALLDALADTIHNTDVEACVVGLPLPLEGEETLICRQIRNVTRRLMRRVMLPFYFMNEALTSYLAWEDLKQSGVKARKRRDVLDQQAAVRILQAFLAEAEKQGPSFLTQAQVQA
ncbi:MAG: Holliday junction resolvase RuvX [Desulfovibrio sp.]|nr:Holliday junction resolvase RuvX [Desulfovibrio sp.]